MKKTPFNFGLKTAAGIAAALAAMLLGAQLLQAGQTISQPAAAINPDASNGAAKSPSGIATSDKVLPGKTPADNTDRPKNSSKKEAKSNANPSPQKNSPIWNTDLDAAESCFLYLKKNPITAAREPIQSKHRKVAAAIKAAKTKLQSTKQNQEIPCEFQALVPALNKVSVDLAASPGDSKNASAKGEIDKAIELLQEKNPPPPSETSGGLSPERKAALLADLKANLNSAHGCIAALEKNNSQAADRSDSLAIAQSKISAAGKEFNLSMDEAPAADCKPEEVSGSLQKALWDSAGLDADSSSELASPGPAAQSILAALLDFSEFKPLEDKQDRPLDSRASFALGSNKILAFSVFCNVAAIVFLFLAQWPPWSSRKAGIAPPQEPEPADSKVLEEAERALEAARRLCQQLAAQAAQFQPPAAEPPRKPTASEAPVDRGRQTISPGAQRPPAAGKQESPIPPRPAYDPQPPAPAGPIADYNRCLDLDLTSAEDLFYGQYSELRRLSCENLDEHRNPNAELRFKVDGRGNFMVLMDQGQMLVLPAIGLDPVESRKLLEGVFKFPEGRGKVRLASAALVKADTTESFLVRERGIFERA